MLEIYTIYGGDMWRQALNAVVTILGTSTWHTLLRIAGTFSVLAVMLSFIKARKGSLLRRISMPRRKPQASRTSPHRITPPSLSATTHWRSSWALPVRRDLSSCRSPARSRATSPCCPAAPPPRRSRRPLKKPLSKLPTVKKASETGNPLFLRKGEIQNVTRTLSVALRCGRCFLFNLKQLASTDATE